MLPMQEQKSLFESMPFTREVKKMHCFTPDSFPHRFTDSLVYYAVSLNTATLSGDIFLNTFLTGLVEVGITQAMGWDGH